MNQLKPEKRRAIVQLLVEGCSIATVSRATGASKATVMRLVSVVGAACWAFHDRYATGVGCDRVEVDETWSFVAMKRKNVPEEKSGMFGNGDVWLWTAIASQTRLLLCWRFADHSSESARDFIGDIRRRAAGEFIIATDGLHSYPRSISSAFPQSLHLVDVTGANTTRVERFNLTLRMGNRRFTRSTNAFSKTVEAHFYAMAIFAFHYNFVRVHRTLKTTPAVAAGLIDYELSFDDLLNAGMWAEASACQPAIAQMFKRDVGRILRWGASNGARHASLVKAATA